MVLAAVFSAINLQFLRLAPSIGILVASFGLFGLNAAYPSLGLVRDAHSFVSQLQFSKALLDGMLGLLLFGLAFAKTGHAGDGLPHFVILFLREAVGGACLDLLLGWVAFRAMRMIDDFGKEVLITLALALSGYVLALALDVSAPVMAVCAGLLVGAVGRRDGMSDTTEKYVTGFWLVVNHILNAVPFLMIGLDAFALDVRPGTVAIGFAAILL